VKKENEKLRVPGRGKLMEGFDCSN